MTGNEPREYPYDWGRYQILAQLAEGGMAEIYLARQQSIEGFERLVVLKKVLPELAEDEEIVKMFLDEARLAAKLSHPNIVQIFDFGKNEQDYFLAMEHLEGEALSDVMNQMRPTGLAMPASLSGGIVAQICDGLEYAHTLRGEDGSSLQIVHRDISPHNIIVLFSGFVKLVDFGIAKTAMNISRTRVGIVKGKVAYMSPEHCLGKPVDARSDVFSLGVVFWELLANRRLFWCEDADQNREAVLHNTIPFVSKVAPGVPPELDAVVYRALQRNPSRRFQSAGEMGAAIRDYLRQAGEDTGPAGIASFIEKVFIHRVPTRIANLDQLTAEPARPSPEQAVPDLTPGDGPADGRTQRVEAAAAQSPRKSGRRSTLIGGLVVLITTALAVILALWWWETTRPDPDVSHGAVVKMSDAEPEESQADPNVAFLSVRSQPAGCAVDLDGKALSEVTPLEDVQVVAGREHRVTVRCPRRKPQVQTVVPSANEKMSLIFSPTRVAPPRPRTGILKLVTEPWSEVYLGKRRLGITPLAGEKLPAGRHVLTLVNPSKGIRKTVRVTIRPNEVTTLKLDLFP